LFFYILEGKPEARLRLYIGGMVEAMLDHATAL